MKPGQITLNEFEVAILEHMDKDEPSLHPLIPQLRVLSREFTGVGSFTNFDCKGSSPDLGDYPVGYANISMPNVPNGMGAVLFCENGNPIAGKHYSGKFLVRIPPEVHRKLAIQAAESGVSLNRLASSKLSQ